MEKGDSLKAILRSDRTVFSIEDIAHLWGESITNAARVRLSYYVRRGELCHIRRGLYARDRNYDHWELATRIFTPAYVSFETVLARAGVILQCIARISVASYLHRGIDCRGQRLLFRKLKYEILTHPDGVEHTAGRSVATPERALLDTLYLYPEYHFDNLYGLDWEKVFEWLPLYHRSHVARQAISLYDRVTSHL